MRLVSTLLARAAPVACATLLAGVAVGCSNSSPDPKGDPQQAVAQGEGTQSPGLYPAAQPKRSDEGESVEREGPLEVGKGTFITGAMIPEDALEKQFGPDWRRLAGRTIRVRGILRVHRCAPEEQCLTTGNIPSIEPRFMELVETVPLDPTSRYLCFDDCDRADRACKKTAPNSKVLGECNTRYGECRKRCER